jgi:hypothetical protein
MKKSFENKMKKEKESCSMHHIFHWHKYGLHYSCELSSIDRDIILYI